MGLETVVTESLGKATDVILAANEIARHSVDSTCDSIISGRAEDLLSESQLKAASALFNDEDLLEGFIVVDESGDLSRTSGETSELTKDVKKIQKFLEENGFDLFDLGKLNAEGHTPLTLAIAKGLPGKKIKQIIKAGAFVNQSQRNGLSPWQMSVQTNNPELANILLDNHVDLHQPIQILESESDTIFRRMSDMLPELTTHENPKKSDWKKFAKKLIKAKKDRDYYIVPPPPVTSLVFEGGGAKGTVYVGALEVLEKENIHRSVKRVAGSSAGGITALLVALGYSAAEIKKEMSSMNFNDFKDGSGGIFGSLKRLFFGKGHGMHKGEVFYRWAQEKIANKLSENPNATFRDLHDAMGRNPLLKDLFLTGTNLTTGRSEVFSFENTPDMKLADAVRITMSFPGAFEAYPITNSEGITHYYADGGIKNNYPMNIFDDEKYIPEGYSFNSCGSNPGVLGFKVDNTTECDDILWNKPKADSSSGFSFFGWISKLAKSARVSDKDEVKQKYSTNTIQIHDTNKGTLQFDLSEEEKEELRLSGERTTDSHLKMYCDRDVVLGKEDEVGSLHKTRPELDRRISPEQLRELRKSLIHKRQQEIESGTRSSSSRVTALNYRIAQIEEFLGDSVPSAPILGQFSLATRRMSHSCRMAAARRTSEFPPCGADRHALSVSPIF